MTEETKDGIQVEAPNDGTPLNTVEDQAREQGWVPKEDFGGEDHKWVEAGEFIRRGELFKKIDQQNRHIKQNTQQIVALEQFKSHYLKMQDIANKTALETLKAERKAARLDGDFDKADALEDQMEAVKEQAEITKREIQATTEVPDIPQEVNDWVERNEWYNKDMPMKAYADSVATQLANEGKSGTALLKELDVEIRKAFPQKFTNPNRERASAVASPNNKGTSRKDSYELSEQETRVMNTLVSGGHITKEQYIADLKKVKGIK